MKAEDTIREGDKVNVLFELLPAYSSLTVVAVPTAPGESYILRGNGGIIYYVQHFAVMERLKP